jgi:hypothetical protein
MSNKAKQVTVWGLWFCVRKSVGGHLIASKSAIRQFLADAANKSIPAQRR